MATGYAKTGAAPTPKPEPAAAATTTPPIPPPPGSAPAPTAHKYYVDKKGIQYIDGVAVGKGGSPEARAAVRAAQAGTWSGASGGAGGGAPSGTGANQQPGNFNTVTATADPYLKTGADVVKKRLEDPTGSTNRAIDVATSHIRDAGEGQAQGIRNMLASRGVAGTGVEANMMGGLAAAQQRDIAGASAGIAMDREKANDAFMLGATGALGAPGAAERADRGLGLSAEELEIQRFNAAAADRRANAALESQNYLAYLDALLSM